MKTETDKTTAALKTEIINMIPSSNPVDPSIAENAINELVQSSIQTALKNIHENKIIFTNYI